MSTMSAELYDALTSAGVPEGKARAAAQTVAEKGDFVRKEEFVAVQERHEAQIAALSESQKDMATKGDILQLSERMTAMFNQLRAEMKEMKAEMKADNADLKSLLTTRMVLFLGVFSALIVTLNKVL